MLYDLNKKGTIIITIGRSGSHLLGDIISNNLTQANVRHKNLLENFLNPSLDFYNVNDFYQSCVKDTSNKSLYIISQIQDFTSKLWLLNHGIKWLSDYHVVILKRKNQVDHFFSRQILENFHSIIPVHTIKGKTLGTFDNLKNQKATVSIDSVWQFYSEQQILNRFNGDTTVYYEDMISWLQVNNSKYLKNNYTVSFNDLFTNYDAVVTMLSGNNDK